MKVRDLFPKPVRRELEALEAELRGEHPEFDPRDPHEPLHLTALVLCWLVSEVLKLREAVAKARELR